MIMSKKSKFVKIKDYLSYISLYERDLIKRAALVFRVSCFGRLELPPYSSRSAESRIFINAK